MPIPPLSADLTDRVLNFLGVARAAPTVELVDALITAYAQTVPWESAFRIVRRAAVANTEDCPRWPEMFWNDAMTKGGGGTCFESNYAFFSLLRALGYAGYLTVNNMRDDGGSYPSGTVVPSIGCHSAIVLQIDGKRWLTDAGLPLYCPIPLASDAITHRSHPIHDYTIRPNGDNRFHVERNHHPQTNCFTLIDVPIDNATYRARTIRDYGEDGLFLESVIITKIVEGEPWRFSSRELPLRLECFANHTRTEHPLPADRDEAASTVAQHFSMDEQTVQQALAQVLPET